MVEGLYYIEVVKVNFEGNVSVEVFIDIRGDNEVVSMNEFF